MAKMGEWRNDVWCWNFVWRRGLFVWEEELLANLLDVLAGKVILAGVDDSWFWLGKSAAPYVVEEAYVLLRESGERQPDHTFKFLWDSSIPLKVVAFCWRSILDRIPTSSNLVSRGIVLSNGYNLCRFCNAELETTSDLFLHCRFSYFVWMFVYNWIRLDTALTGNLKDLLLQHSGLISGRASNEVWRMFWFATIWSIWLHRNDLIFKQGTLDFDNVTELIKIKVWSWSNSRVKKECFSFMDWCLNPLACLKGIH